MMFRLAEEKDIEQIAKLYEHIHDAEESGNAVIGWNREVYPTKQTALEGISEKDMFVLRKSFEKCENSAKIV